MALTAAYFIGEILIPNINTEDDPQGVNLDNLNWFIARYEEEYLRLLLGDDLYDEYAAGIAEVVPASKWTALKDQIYFKTTVGTGETAVDYLFSPAANYVYFQHSRNEAQQTLQNGAAEPLVENATAVYPMDKQIRAWNQMSRWSARIVKWIYEHQSDYTTFDPSDNYLLATINEFGI